jgi:DNA primase catalytic subunit
MARQIHVWVSDEEFEKLGSHSQGWEPHEILSMVVGRLTSQDVPKKRKKRREWLDDRKLKHLQEGATKNTNHTQTVAQQILPLFEVSETLTTTEIKKALVESGIPASSIVRCLNEATGLFERVPGVKASRYQPIVWRRALSSTSS